MTFGFLAAGDHLIRLGFDITSVIKEGSAGLNESPASTQWDAGENVPEWRIARLTRRIRGDGATPARRRPAWLSSPAGSAGSR